MRQSDRWVTPGVVITGLLVAGAVAIATVAAMAWLTAQGADPGPLVDLAAKVVTGLSALGGLLLQLAQRNTVAKVERNTGQLMDHTGQLADVVDAKLGAYAEDEADETMPPGYPPPHTVAMPPVPPVPSRHRAAPGAWGDEDRPR
jgi:hypothetical protein